MPGNPEPPISDGPPLIECDLPLGRPGLVAHNELVLSGWAASPKGVAGVAVQIGDRVWNASYGFDTPALADRLPGFPKADRGGYRLAIDTSGWEPGPQYVTVAAFDVEGGRSAVEGQVELAPFEPSGRSSPDAPAAADVLIAVDPPLAAGACEVDGPLEITGWAHAREGIEAVVVTLDGATLQYEALRPVARPDLIERLGPDAAREAGFALRLAASDCPPGEHSLSIAAVSRDGRRAGIECELTCRSEPATLAVEPASVVPAPATADHPPATDDARMWQDRALLAEADAALSRAEAELARRAQEATLRALRDAEARPGGR